MLKNKFLLTNSINKKRPCSLIGLGRFLFILFASKKLKKYRGGLVFATMTCFVCVEEFDKSTRKQISCEYDCAFSACIKCYKNFILNSNSYAFCMGCKKEFTRKYMIEQFGYKFFSTVYKTHCENVLFDREKSMLPSTQSSAEKEIQVEKIKYEIDKLRQKLSDIQTKTSDKKQFIHACANENCNGFLAEDWICGLCEKTTCKKCNEITNDDHICKQSDIETVNLLKKDSKICPGCGIAIFKIIGCDSMFCTECKTSFCWRTGKIDKRPSHNPHYVEYIRNNKNAPLRDPNDIQCGREIDNNFIRHIKNNHLVHLCRSLIHLREVTLVGFTNKIVTNNEDLRIAFLIKKITEKKFKQKLQQRTKATEKNTEISNILRMFITCFTEILYRYDYKNDTSYVLHKKLNDEFDNLLKYTNECLETTAKTYKTTKYYLTDTCSLMY